MTIRVVAGIALATLVAILARQARSLSTGGAAAAVVVGTLAVAASWGLGALLIVYFVTASLLSRLGAVRKERRTTSIVAKSGPRDAAQVLANGGAFALAVLGMLLRPSDGWIALAVGSLSASAADTWATEVGTAAGRDPRSIVTLKPVPPGTSGGVTVVGTLASVAGAALIASTAVLLGLSRPRACLTAAVGGVAGAVLDSLLGATLQSRRRCDGCGRATERVVHDCGAPTRPTGGLAWLDNDAVNFIASLAGGLLAVALAG